MSHDYILTMAIPVINGLAEVAKGPVFPTGTFLCWQLD